MSESAPCTRAVRAGIESDTQHGAVVPPLHLSTNYSFEGLGGKRAYDYSRSGNPTRDLLGNALAELEQGAGAVVTSSGMSAVALALELVPAGATVLAAHDCYGGTWRLLDAWAKKGRFSVDFVDLTDPRRAGRRPGAASRRWCGSRRRPTRCCASPTSATSRRPRMRSARCWWSTTPSSRRRCSSRCVLGADVVVHSTTKYINGHSDVVGGAVVARDAGRLRAAEVVGQLQRPHRRAVRQLPDPARPAHAERAPAPAPGKRRAHRRCSWTAMPAVRKVYYPGLAGHAGHALAARQQQGFGAMLSFELEGDVPQIEAFVDGLQYFSLAESLGGVESLIAHPASMTHASMAAEARRTAGIADSLLRLSVGIEDGDDLLRDLDAALVRAAAVTCSKRRVIA